MTYESMELATDIVRAALPCASHILAAPELRSSQSAHGADAGSIVQGGGCTEQGGGTSSITPPADRTLHTVREDYVEMDLWLSFPQWDQVSEHLTYHEDRRRASGGHVLIQLGDVSLALSPPLATSGFRSRFTLTHEHFCLSLQHRQAWGGEVTANARATLRAPLRQLPQGWFQFVHILNCLGAQLHRNRLSRVDVAIDLLDVPFSEVLSAYQSGHYVPWGCRHAAQTYEGQTTPTSLNFTTKHRRLLIYDKLCEMARRNNTLVECDALWCCVPEHAIRVEYQLRREYLGSSSVQSVEHWLAYRGSIVSALVSSWVRLVDRPPTRGNQRRASWHPIWNRLNEAVVAWEAGCEAPPPRGPDLDQRPRVHLDRLINQAVGCLYTAAVHGNTSRMPFELIPGILARLLSFSGDERWQATRIEHGLEIESAEVLQQRKAEAAGQIVEILDRYLRPAPRPRDDSVLPS